MTSTEKSIVLKISDLEAVVKNGDKMILSQGGEAVLQRFLEIKAQVEAAEKQIKEALEAAALHFDPNFRSIEGESIKVGYQYFGSKFAIDQVDADKLPDDMVKIKVTKTPDSKAIEAFVEEHGTLPVGIRVNNRKKHIVIKSKNDPDEEV